MFFVIVNENFLITAVIAIVNETTITRMNRNLENINRVELVMFDCFLFMFSVKNVYKIENFFAISRYGIG